MAEILLVNPKRRKKPVAKKKRTAAQKRATRRLVELNKRRARASKRRKNPVRKRRRKTTTTTTRRRRRAAPVARRRRVRRKRNPVRMNMRGITNSFVDGGIGAVGAIGVDMVFNYLPLPANLKTGFVGTGMKGLTAIAGGLLLSNMRLVRPAMAAKLTNGAFTVIMHEAIKRGINQFAPGITRDAYIDPYDETGMGAYVNSGYPAGVVPGLGMHLPDLGTDPLSMDETGFGAYGNNVDYMDELAFA